MSINKIAFERMAANFGLKGDAYIATHNIIAAYESQKTEQPDEATGDLMDKCYAAFGIGKHSRSERTLLTNIENAARRSSCLSFIEGFLEVVAPDEDDDCPLNWGDSPEAYLEKFKAAWNACPKRESGSEKTLTIAVRQFLKEYSPMKGADGWFDVECEFCDAGQRYSNPSETQPHKDNCPFKNLEDAERLV